MQPVSVSVAPLLPYLSWKAGIKVTVTGSPTRTVTDSR